MNKFLKNICDYYIIFCIYALIGWIYEVSWFLIVRHEFVNRGVLFGPFLPIYGFGILLLLLCLKKFMKSKHLSNNILYTSISLATIISFIFITIIEYTTTKIYDIDIFFNNYGLILVIINLFFIISTNILISKSKKDRKIKNIDLTPVIVFLAIWIITTLVEYVAHLGIDKLTGKMLWDYSQDFLNFNSRICFDASRNFAIGGTILLYTIQPLIDKYLKKINLKKEIIIVLIIGIPMLIDVII